jgi:hypothetical protein
MHTHKDKDKPVLRGDASVSTAMIPRNRTRRAASPATGAAGASAEAPEAPVYGQSPGLEQFLNVNASEAYRRPWHRLERGLRLNRIRRFIDAEKERMTLADADVLQLTTLLHKAMDKKLLNSKTAVIYDIEKEDIQEIKGLVYHKAADGRILSQIVEKKAGVTFRRKDAAAAAASKSESGSTEKDVSPGQ